MAVRCDGLACCNGHKTRLVTAARRGEATGEATLGAAPLQELAVRAQVGLRVDHHRKECDGEHAVLVGGGEVAQIRLECSAIIQPAGWHQAHVSWFDEE
jgi:hypothetical protein